MSRANFSGLTTLDIILTAVLGILWGLAGGPMGFVWQFLTASFGPLATALWAPFVMSIVLAPLIIRKPGAATLNGILNGLGQWIGGNPLGISLLLFGVVMGAGVELVFFITRYRSYSAFTSFMAAGVAQVFALVQSALMFGWGALGIGVLLGTWAITFLASGVQSGLVAYGLASLLRKSGALRTFKVSEAS